MAHNNQAMGIWPFKDAVDYSEDTKKMEAIAWAINSSQMPSEISISQAEKLMADVKRAVDRFVSDAQPVIENSPGVRDSLRAAVKVVTNDYRDNIEGRLRSIINQSKAQGIATVPSFRFNHRDIHLTLLSVVHGYEAVQFIDEAKPFLVRSMPFTMGIFVVIGRAVEAIVGVTQAVISGLGVAVKAAASGTEMLISILKWGSVAGGLYLLYGALKPEKAKR